jgi:hypothetical protein
MGHEVSPLKVEIKNECAGGGRQEQLTKENDCEMQCTSGSIRASGYELIEGDVRREAGRAYSSSNERSVGTINE